MSRRIFIVEDEILVAFEMAQALEDMGFTVVGPSVHLENGNKVAKTEDFDLAVLDVNLGKGKTSKPIADILKARQIPFLYITAYDRAQVDFVEDSDVVLSKPLSIDDLANAMDKLIVSRS